MSCRIVFFGHCGKRSSYTSQAEAETAAIEYGSAAGYACEAYLCDKHLSKTVIDKTILCWHFRAKSETAPPMTRTQWECRAAEYRVIEAKAAVEREAARLQRAVEQEAKRAEAAELEAKRLARRKAHAAKVAREPKIPPPVRTPRVLDGLSTRDRWKRDGKCVACGGKHGERRPEKKMCAHCADRFAGSTAARTKAQATWRLKKAEHGNR